MYLAPSPSWRRRFALLILSSLLLAAGCSKAKKSVPVSGNISVEGKPLPSGVVTFSPDESKGNTEKGAPVGTVTDGRYEVKGGVPLGWYKVTVNTMMPPPATDTMSPGGKPPAMPSANAPRINQKYLTPASTDLSVEVVENAAPDRYDLKLTR